MLQTVYGKVWVNATATTCGKGLVEFPESQSSPDRIKSEAGIVELQRETGNAISISTPIYQDSSCSQWCSCECHTATRIKTPTWMHKVIGLLFVRYYGVRYLGLRSCSEHSCRRKSVSQARITYYFPSWFLSRKIQFVANWKPLEGPELLLRLPRVVGSSALIFWYAGSGDLAGMKGLFAQRLASPYDVSAATGSSALQVCPNLASSHQFGYPLTSFPQLVRRTTGANGNDSVPLTSQCRSVYGRF